VVIVDGEDDLGLPAWVPVLHQRDGSAAEAFDTTATPYAFALDSAGVVTASAIPASVDQHPRRGHRRLRNLLLQDHDQLR
jgi:hypothetical protein